MIDVSSNNHPNRESINWPEVHRAGYKAVMIKCSEGTDYVNPWRISDGHGAVAAGMLVGYYHFARPVVGHAEREAWFALNAINGLPRSIGLALDLEDTGALNPAELATWAKTFLATIAAKNIGSPIYSYRYFIDNNLPGFPFGHHVWLASPGVPPRFNVWAWQSGQKEVPGIPGLTDVGMFYG